MAGSSQQQQHLQISSPHPPPAAPLSQLQSTPSLSSHQNQIQQVQELVDLNEWYNYRVLAKRKDIYVPGVIRRTSDIPNSVLVELDHPEGQRELYHDIFSSGRYDVISDACPSLSDVNLFFSFKIQCKFNGIFYFFY